MKFLNTYNEQCKHCNESIKDFLKPKSEESILKSMENLSDGVKFEKSCQYGIISIVKYLIDIGFNPSYKHNYGIRIASENGHVEVVKELLKDKRVDPSVDDNTSILWSSENGHVEVVKELLKDKRVDPSDGDNSAIIYASQNGHLEVVKELLKDKRVNPSDYDNAPIKWSSENGHLEVVKELLKDKRVTDKLSKDDLVKYQKQIEGINESIKQFLKPKSEDKILKELNKLSDDEKFKKSCQYGLISIVKDMISKGFDPSIDNNYGIYISIVYKHLDVVKLLLKDKRVDPSDYNNDAIRCASSNGSLEIVKELLKDERVDPSDSDNHSIRIASLHDHLDIVKELLKDKRVTDKLSKEKLEFYKNKVKYL